MSRKSSTPPNSAGHQGPDRQPVKGAGGSDGANPDPEQAAEGQEVRRSSKEAGDVGKKRHAAPDALHPEPRVRKK